MFLVHKLFSSCFKGHKLWPRNTPSLCPSLSLLLFSLSHFLSPCQLTLCTLIRSCCTFSGNFKLSQHLAKCRYNGTHCCNSCNCYCCCCSCANLHTHGKHTHAHTLTLTGKLLVTELPSCRLASFIAQSPNRLCTALVAVAGLPRPPLTGQALKAATASATAAAAVDSVALSATTL